MVPRVGLVLDLLGQARSRSRSPVKVARCWVVSSTMAAGVALVDGVAQLVGFLATGANDPAAVVALVGLGPTRKLQVVTFEVIGAAWYRD